MPQSVFTATLGQVRMTIAPPVALILIDNPAKRNALNTTMWVELRGLAQQAATAPGVRCVMVRGGGADAFTAGADVSEFPLQRGSFKQVKFYQEQLVEPALRALLDCPRPTVAAIDGACMGGGLEIALACDVRIATPTSRFGAPTAMMGFPFAAGETELLYRSLGRSVTTELLLCSRVFDAREALNAGIVHRLVARQAFDSELERLVARMAGASPRALALNKAQLVRLLRNTNRVSRRERARTYTFTDWSDYSEGVAAFLAHRKPIFGE